MKKPFYLFLLGFALVTLAGGCIEYEVIGENGEDNQLDAEPMVVSDTELPSATSSEDVAIGGGRDGHGCLVGAGYQYCPSKEKCVRDWEEDCAEIDESGLTQTFDTEDENLAASGTISYIKASDHYKQNNGSQIYVTNLNANDCDGCYDVTVNYKANVNDNVLRMTATVSMEDWNVTDISLEEVPIQERTANECVDVGGRVVDTTEDGACNYQEAFIGNISDRDQPNICCK
ncbi:hypothetical protein GF391_02115 [Candidatus Uhrbacteria bacterium]|nr:hypothetical protein [Candidatus Uhrbacteria bacterium]